MDDRDNIIDYMDETNYICDGCHKTVDYNIEENTDDGHSYFCNECWEEETSTDELSIYKSNN